MAADVGEFLRQHKLTKVHLMGHSMCVPRSVTSDVLRALYSRAADPAQKADRRVLRSVGRGGKVVMTVALHSALNAPVKSLISVDMAPSEGRISPEYVPGSLRLVTERPPLVIVSATEG